jgi:hypothetical protein
MFNICERNYNQCGLISELWVKRVAEPVTQKIEGKDYKTYNYRRKNELEGVALKSLAGGVGKASERGHGRLDAEPTKLKKLSVNMAEVSAGLLI